jgi:TRAP-type C4-dicarboxylate transport system permease small subunit
MNPPSKSKINRSSGVGLIVNAAIGIAVAYDLLPPDAAAHVATIANAAILFLIVVFRTWFTEPKQ